MARIILVYNSLPFVHESSQRGHCSGAGPTASTTLGYFTPSSGFLAPRAFLKIRGRLAQNSDTPEEFLKKLGEDDDIDVAHKAKKTLQKAEEWEQENKERVFNVRKHTDLAKKLFPEYRQQCSCAHIFPRSNRKTVIHADLVMLISRDEIIHPFARHCNRGRAEIIIAKNRRGSKGMAALNFINLYGLFENFAG